MYQNFLFILILVSGLLNTAYSQTDPQMEQRLNNKMKKVKKEFDRMYPGNPNAKITEIRLERMKLAANPIAQKSINVKQEIVPGKYQIDPTNIVFVKSFENLKWEYQNNIVKWATNNGYKSPYKLYYDLICYLSWPLELMKELPDVNKLDIKSAYDFRKAHVEYTLYHLGKKRYLSKFPQFQDLMHDIRLSSMNEIADRKILNELTSGRKSISNNQEYWYVYSDMILEVLDEIRQ